MSPTISTEQPLAGTDLSVRAALYGLFARLLRGAPSESLLRDVVQGNLLTVAEQGAQHPVEDGQWPEQAEAIAVDYARLFAVPGEQAVQPYESVYCDTLTIDTSTACSPYFEPEPHPGGLTGFLYGPSAIAVREVYRRAGFELDAASHELPDHLAIELEFMGRLLERGDCEQAKVFFSEHLGRWVFRCLEDIAQRTTSGFYRAVARALATALHVEL